MKINLLLFISAIILFSCSETESDSKLSDSKSTKKSEKKDTEVSESNNTIKEGEYYFKGVIDQKYPFHMKFIVQDKTIKGSYFYDSQKKEIILEGNINNGVFELDEKYKDKITGHFTSEVCTTDSISGVWKSPKGKKMSFALFNSTFDNYSSALEETKQNWTLNELLDFTENFTELEFPFQLNPIGFDVGEEVPSFEDWEITKFLDPNFDRENDWGTYFYPAAKIISENYIALIYYQNFMPGAFGIENSGIILKTFSKNGEAIDESYLGCHCVDRNLYDYDITDESFEFYDGYILVTGTYESATFEGVESEGIEPYSSNSPINKKISISSDGKIK